MTANKIHLLSRAIVTPHERDRLLSVHDVTRQYEEVIFTQNSVFEGTTHQSPRRPPHTKTGILHSGKTACKFYTPRAIQRSIAQT